MGNPYARVSNHISITSLERDFLSVKPRLFYSSRAGRPYQIQITQINTCRDCQNRQCPACYEAPYFKRIFKAKVCVQQRQTMLTKDKRKCKSYVDLYNASSLTPLTRSDMDHTVLPANNTISAFTRKHSPGATTHIRIANA